MSDMQTELINLVCTRGADIIPWHSMILSPRVTGKQFWTLFPVSDCQAIYKRVPVVWSTNVLQYYAKVISSLWWCRLGVRASAAHRDCERGHYVRCDRTPHALPLSLGDNGCTFLYVHPCNFLISSVITIFRFPNLLLKREIIDVN